MSDPITAYDLGSSVHQEYVSKASGYAKRQALKNIRHSTNSQRYKSLSLTVYLSWRKNFVTKAKKRTANPRKCTCPS